MSSTVYYNKTIFDQIFHVKPYTQCYQCLRCPRPRCKKCVNIITNKISTKQYLKTARSTVNGFQKSNSSPKMNCRNETQIGRKEDNIKIMSKYELWMEGIKNKKNKENRIFDQWPRKKPFKDKNLIRQGNKVPKFQKWQRKLIQQFMYKG